MVRRFGFVTIGQSPRNDVLDSMLPARLHNSTLHRGALDDLTMTEIQSISPHGDQMPLVTRLAYGSEILVSKEALMPHLQRAVNQVVADGARALVILCTGSFPDLVASVPVIMPDRVLHANVDAVLPAGSIGVIMPHEGQMEVMRRTWQSTERRFIGAVASPYTGSESLSELGIQFAAEGADLIVMDCMGFTADMKTMVGAASGVPVILANRLVGRVIEELME